MTRRRYTYVPITADDLRALGACEDQVAKFAAWRPNGATPDDIPDALAVGLDVCWLAVALTPELSSADVFGALYAEFQPRLDALYAEFQLRRDAPGAEFEQRRDAFYAEFETRWDAIGTEYLSRRDALAVDYLLACWPVWEVTP